MHFDQVAFIVNLVISILFVACYSYQYVYIVVGLIKKPKPHKPTVPHRYAVLISARNEQTVIADLIHSIREQDYPSELIDVYVVADNCTDETAAVAKEAGATVFERFDTIHVGKGRAINFLLSRIHETVGKEHYDAYAIFDADNILEQNYFTEINKTVSDGYRVVTSYRNSKNFSDNWISAGYALWFLRESAQLNYPRHLLGSSCVVYGTGFLFTKDVLEECGGWNFFSMTEDTEFTAYNLLRGERIGFCYDAVFYDEQPTKFLQSWTQRLRWSRGYLQVLHKDGKKLLKGLFTPHIAFPCFDFTFNIFPAYLLTLLATFANAVLLILGFLDGQTLVQLGNSLFGMVIGGYGFVYLVGLMAIITEWKRIHAKPVHKILYTFTFPFFMMTFIPIAIHAVFAKPQWKPIEHTHSTSLKEIHEQNDTKKKE